MLAPLVDIKGPPPQNQEAEQAVIGAIFCDDDAYWDVVDIVKPEDFYREAHRILFAAIRSLRSHGQHVDYIAMLEKLRNGGQIQAIGGEEYLRAIADCEPSAANAAWHARIVREKSLLRRMSQAGQELIQWAHGNVEGVSAMLAQSQERILSLLEDASEATWTPYNLLMSRMQDRLEEVREQGRLMTGLPTGLPGIDKLIGGLLPADLIVIGARPSTGKTAWMQAIAETVAGAGVVVAIFSLEMAEDPLAIRAIQSRTRMDGYTLRTGNYDREIGGDRIARAAAELAILPIFVNDKTGWHYAEIQAQARRLILREHVGLVMVDYIGIVKGDNPQNRVRELGTVAQGLKELAKRHKVPVVVLSQLSRLMEREKRRPQMSDLRDSGEIEQIADVVILLHRMKGEEDGLMIVDKSRNLQTGDVKVRWHGPTMRYSERDEIHEEE